MVDEAGRPDGPRAPFELPRPPVNERTVPPLLHSPPPTASTPKGGWLPSRLGPLSPEDPYVHAWFVLMGLTSREAQPDGLTLRQVVRSAQCEFFRGAEEAFLQHMVTTGDVVRREGSAQRYVAGALDKRLAWHLEQALLLAPGEPLWVAFMEALNAHELEGKQYTWNLLREAFAALVEGFPGWPHSVKTDARLYAERWLPRVARVRPPMHLREEDELLKLRDENALLRSLLEQESVGPPVDVFEKSSLGGKKAELRRRVEELEVECVKLTDLNQELTWEVDALEAELETFARPDAMEAVDAFLRGEVSDLLPAHLPSDEVQRLRDLVEDTRGPRFLQRAFAAKLGAIYRSPLSFVRLTSQAFAGLSHPFESLHRARVGGYRIGFGVSKRVPTILHIGLRDHFYATFFVRLDAWSGRMRGSL